MSTETSSAVTWQKIAIIIAILTLALPAAVRFAWKIVFPPNYLLYEVAPSVQVGDIVVGGLVVVNGGGAPQKEVALYLPSRAANPKYVTVEVSSPRRSSLRSLFDAEPNVPLTSFSKESGSRIPLGTIEPDEEVRVTFKATKPDNDFSQPLSLRDARVESSAMTAIEADGIRRPEFHEDLHTFYVDSAPYLLAFLFALIGLAVLINFIHDVFFDTPQKKMTRLWRQMDTLQEQIDKERRYE